MKYTTKDSGKRKVYASGMNRDMSEGKPRFYLIMPRAIPYQNQLLTRWAELMARGAEKYDARNWEKAQGQEEEDHAIESLLRHTMQFIHGEDDEDHAAAILFNTQEIDYIRQRRKQDNVNIDITP
jgi:hypothetical protein